MANRSARRRPSLCVSARRALIFEGWVRGPEFTHADHAVDIANGIGWTIIVVAAGHHHYGGVVTRLRRRCPHLVPACDRASSAFATSFLNGPSRTKSRKIVAGQLY